MYQAREQFLNLLISRKSLKSFRVMTVFLISGKFHETSRNLEKNMHSIACIRLSPKSRILTFLLASSEQFLNLSVCGVVYRLPVIFAVTVTHNVL